MNVSSSPVVTPTASIADIVTLLPRKERTVWETTDERFKFVRFRNGWAITARSFTHGATHPHTDREALINVGLLNSSYSPIVCFETLRKAREALALVGAIMDDPPTNSIQQRPITYLVDPIPYRILRVDGGWEVSANQEVFSKIYRQLALHHSVVKLRTFDMTDVIRSLDDQQYPTRKAAFEAIKELLVSIELQAANHTGY